MTPRYEVSCPKCGAKPGDRCVTLTGGKTTDTHTSRINAAWDKRRRRWVNP